MTLLRINSDYFTNNELFDEYIWDYCCEEYNTNSPTQDQMQEAHDYLIARGEAIILEE